MSRLAATAVSVTLGGRRIVGPLDLALGAGTLVGLAGPNGAGKSTLMRALAGLVPAGGAITLDGAALGDLPAPERARRLAHVPQDRAVAWALPVEEVVGLGRLPHRGAFAAPGAEDRAAVDRALVAMDLGPLRGRPATELSGGELARALVARALAQETPILLADEPAAGLDPAHQIALMAEFRRLADAGRTVLVSLHDLTLAARWCDRVVLLEAGRVVADGAPRTVLTRERLAEVYGIDVHLAEDEGGLVVVPTGRRAPPTPREAPPWS